MKQVVMVQSRQISSLESKTGPKGWSYVRLSDLAKAVDLSTKKLIQRYFCISNNGLLPMIVNRLGEPSRFIWASEESVLTWIDTNKPYSSTTLEVAKGWADDVLESDRLYREKKLIGNIGEEIAAALDSELFVSLVWREDSVRDSEMAVRINHIVTSRTAKQSGCIPVAYSRGTDDDPAITWHWIFYIERLIDIAFVPYGEHFNERVARLGYTRLAASLDPAKSGMYFYKKL